MKYLSRILILILALAAVLSCFTACDGGEGGDETTAPAEGEIGEFVDLAGTLKFDPSSGRVYTEATVKTYVDGDTTHFNVPSSIIDSGILKARYLGINTPESTGQIEPWGKKASNYTKEALMNATSIIVESDTDRWNPDSTGDRYLVWVWYKTAEMADYRCLNLEILQNGLAVASKSSDTAYADICTQILYQATTHKLYVHSKEKDPDFFYGAAIPVTLKELKTNIEEYKDKSVGFEGVVVRNSGNTAYVEEYDEETGLYFGIQVYYGFNLDYFGQEILTVGNRILVVGSVQYYETGGTYQISDIKYNAMRPDDESNIKLISQGHEGSYTEVGAKELLDGKVTLTITEVDGENETLVEKTFDRGFLTMHGSASLTNLTIKSIYTTQNEDSSNFGALSITCTAEDGTEFVIRTIVLKDSAGKTITADAFPIGSKINARGVVDVYNGTYQLKVFSVNDITFDVPAEGYDGSAVTITFYHSMGAKLQGVLNTYIAEFNKLYPNITVEHASQGDYDGVCDQIKTALTAGNQPNIAYCYPDHVALYNVAKAVVPLDNFIESTITVTDATGATSVLGLTAEQIADFIPGYYAEGTAFDEAGTMYTLPMSKSTEALYYNKTFFEQNNLKVPTTWEEMAQVCEQIKKIDPDCVPLGYDSEANWFITMCEQYGSDYTSLNEDAHFLFDNETNRSFVKMFHDWYVNGWVTTEEIYGSYTSGLFTATEGQKCYMVIGSTGGASYQQPPQVDGKALFETAMATPPQVNPAAPKVISQGPSLCIFKDSNPQEVVASWLFVKFLTTNVEFQAAFSMASGYAPVIKSVQNNTVYQQWLDKANGINNLTAMSVKLALSQADAYFVSPAFNGFSEARDQVGTLMQDALVATDADIDAAIKRLFENAIDECENAAY